MVRPHDLIKYDFFKSYPHVKRTMKNFLSNCLKGCVINMLFRIVQTKHSFDSVNVAKRQELLFGVKIFTIFFK